MSLGTFTPGEHFCIVIPADAQQRMQKPLGAAGTLWLRHSTANDAGVICKIEYNGSIYPVTVGPEYRTLRDGDEHPIARWQTVSREVNLHHRSLINRPLARIPKTSFDELVPGQTDPGNIASILLTRAVDLTDTDRELRVHEFAAWHVTREGAFPLPCFVEPLTHGVVQLAEHWPLLELNTKSVLLVGAGSIGSHAAEALAGAGIGRIGVVDPDRLLWHNLIRHRLGPSYVGAHKADAIKRSLTELWPSTSVTTYVTDVVEDAARMRVVIPEYDLVLCTADGIDPRRALSHMCRRAAKPLVLACVLDDGGIGEVLRLDPTPASGCLECNRERSRRRGAIDAEADQEAAYGEGLLHKPMTATGPDLALMGTLAAKVSVSTLLLKAGYRQHALPGDHAIIGLHPLGDLLPPYNAKNSLGLRWSRNPRPYKSCPTCNPG